MANVNPARDRYHVTERYRTYTPAARRRDAVSMAGFRAYLTDMGPGTPRARFIIHISEGKRGTLAALPRRAR